MLNIISAYWTIYLSFFCTQRKDIAILKYITSSNSYLTSLLKNHDLPETH